MKRFLCFFLAFCLLTSLSACIGAESPVTSSVTSKTSKTTSTSKSSTTTTTTTQTTPIVSRLLPVGKHRPGTADFYEIQSDFYDYFYPLIGFGHISFSNNDSQFLDDELIQFALCRLSFEDGCSLENGVSKLQIDKMTRRYFDDAPTGLEGLYLNYDPESMLYFPKNHKFTPGVLMSLQELTVREDGICVGEFYRSQLPSADVILAGGQSEADFKESFLGGNYTNLKAVEHIRMTFYQHKTNDGDIYNVIRCIEKIVD